MKYMKCRFSFVVLVVALSTGAALNISSANTSVAPDCEQQLTPATMANLRALYNKSVSSALTPEQQLMARSLYTQKLEAAAATYSTTMERLHEWVIASSTQSTLNAQHTQSTPIKRMFFKPHTKHILNWHKGLIENVTFSPNGKKVIFATPTEAEIWDVTAGELIFALPSHTLCITGVAFSSDNSKIIAVVAGKYTQIWDATTGERIRYFEGTGSLSPDGTNVVVAPTKESEETSTNIWSISTGKKILTLTGHQDIAYNASYSADGSKIITTSSNSNVHIWDAITGKNIHTLLGRYFSLKKASFSPDSTKVVTFADHSPVQIWDALAGKEIYSLPSTGSSFTQNAEFSPDNTQVVITPNNRIAHIFSVTTGKELFKLIGHEHSINNASYSADSTKIVTSSYDSTARAWDAKTGEETYVLTGHTNGVYRATFSPDNTQIVTTSFDSTIRIWDLYITEEEFLQTSDAEENSP